MRYLVHSSWRATVSAKIRISLKPEAMCPEVITDVKNSRKTNKLGNKDI
jgi:hypothetical protein